MNRALVVLGLCCLVAAALAVHLLDQRPPSSVLLATAEDPAALLLALAAVALRLLGPMSLGLALGLALRRWLSALAVGRSDRAAGPPSGLGRAVGGSEVP
jgi:hypothetical protein